MANTMTDKKKNATQSGALDASARGGDKEKARAKATKSQPKAIAQKPAKKGPSTSSRMRNSPPIRFILDAYYELRYKVTWPTFQEARNMTIAVIALSAALAVVLGGVDLGLTKLVQLIVLK